jgi:ATP-dependent protease HslVU (ClpYQ) peptidase subunit
MTFIASFRCHGGIVMCADSQETIGDYKLIVEKLTPVDAGKYTIALGAAGLGNLADSLLDQVQDWVATWGIFKPGPHLQG